MASTIRIGLPLDGAEQKFQETFTKKTGTSYEELRQWVEEVVEPLNYDDNQTSQAGKEAELSATKLGVFPSVARKLIEQVAPFAAVLSVPAQSESPFGNTVFPPEPAIQTKKESDDKPRIVRWRAAGAATDQYRNSAKSFYQRLVAGGSVTNDLIYLTYEKSASKQGITNRDEFLREVKHALGDFVLFVSSENQGWVFPNPGLVFRPDSLSRLFPSLTAERFDSKQYIEPVPVVRVGKGRWKVSHSENGTPPAQPSTATSKKGTKPETVRPTISTPALTRNKLKPLMVGALILILCVGYLTIVMWNVLTGSGGNQIAKNESMILVEGGTFMMGRNAGDEYERPEHSVTVNSFNIDTNEVTREDYEKFIAATNHRQPPDWANGHYPPGTARWPVTGVDWYDADSYAKWAGKGLPTEEEWEYAARGTKGFRYPWGNDWIPGSANANNASQGLADVDKFKGASPFGVVGMVGNAWEWTASRLTAYPGGRIPPQGHGDMRVIRGGSWESDQTSATTTYRWGWPASGGNDYKSTGFRCVKDVSPQSSR